MRRRHAVIATAVLLLCAGFALVSAGPGIGWSFLILVALTGAAAAGGLAVLLWVRLDRMQGDIDRLARSLDGALRELAVANERNSRGIGTLSDTIDRQLGGMLDRIETQFSAAPLPPQSPPQVASAPAPGPMPRKPTGGERLPEGWEAREISLSLEPIVSVSQGAATAFEVHANVLLEDGAELVLRRLSPTADPAEVTAFEHAVVLAAMQTSRHQLGGEGTRLPLHVAFSGATLADEDVVREIASLIEIHSGLAQGLVFSIPAEELAGRDAEVLRGIARLAEAGAGLAIEGWPDDTDVERLKARGALHVKVSADRLLDRLRLGRKAPSGSDLVERALKAEIAVVATDVMLDEDAVALLDIGVDLMRGERFSPPRRLKPGDRTGSALAETA